MNNWGMNEFLIVCSFRYCLSRKTYIVGIFIEFLKENWDSINRNNQDLIHKEIKEQLLEGNCSLEWSEVLEWRINNALD